MIGKALAGELSCTSTGLVHKEIDFLLFSRGPEEGNNIGPDCKYLRQRLQEKEISNYPIYA